MSTSFSPPRNDLLTTEALRGLRFRQRLAAAGGWEGITARPRRDVTIPGIDLRALRARCAKDPQLPQVFRATFQCPVDASLHVYEQIRYRALEKFLDSLTKQGWTAVVDEQHRVQVYPGMYPAVDVRDGTPILNAREYIIAAWFHQPRPKMIRFEIPDSVADDYVIRA